jgi:hypothetical protein
MAIDWRALARQLRSRCGSPRGVRGRAQHATACLIALSATVGAAQPGAGTQAPSHSAERLLIAELAGGSDDPFERIARAVNARLAAACGATRSPEDRCFARHLPPISERVATLYSGPSRSSAPVGYVIAVPFVRPGELDDWGLRLDVERVAQPGVIEPWIADIGDWGYGVHVDGEVRVVGDWVELLHPRAVAGAFLPQRDPSLWVHVSTMEERVVEIAGVPGLPDGSYVILRVTPERVDLHPEVEADTQAKCGEPVAPVGPPPPAVAISPGQFFDSTGRPRFRTKYTKGC